LGKRRESIVRQVARIVGIARIARIARIVGIAVAGGGDSTSRGCRTTTKRAASVMFVKLLHPLAVLLV